MAGWSLCLHCPGHIWVALCEGPDTSVPLWTPSESPWWALESHFKELLIDPQEDHGSKSINTWAPPSAPASRQGLVAHKALPNAKRV